MKRVLLFSSAFFLFMACNNEAAKTAETKKEEPAASTVTLPYTAGYSSQFNDKVSDQDLLLVLNSYKYWETGDMNAVAGTLADSVRFEGSDGTRYSGAKAGLVDMWTKHRDSISTVQIMMDAWTKDHSIDKNDDYVLVWYKEIDTYKSGRVDSAYFADINQVKNGKISWFSQYKQALTKK